MLAGSDVAPVSSCTGKSSGTSAPYTISLPGFAELNIYDTIGLDGVDGGGLASRNLASICNLVHALDHTLCLLVYVIRGPRIKESSLNNYRAIHKSLRQEGVPIVAVITGMEHHDDSAQSWWDKNAEFFRSRGVAFSDRVCITGTLGKVVNGAGIFESEYRRSMSELKQLVMRSIVEIRPILSRNVCYSGKPTLAAIEKFLGTVQPSQTPLSPQAPRQVQFEVSLEHQWSRFRDWSAELDKREARLVEMYWLKEPFFPGHEYVLLRYDLNLSSIWLRLERDSSSWMTILGHHQQETQTKRSRCKDKVTVRDSFSALAKPKDRVVASLFVAHGVQSSFVTFLHLALLLRCLNHKAQNYDIVTFNCWWYAGCIWESVAYWLRQAGSETFFRIGTKNSEEKRVAGYIHPSRGQSLRSLDWEATIFPRNLLDAHLLIADRAIPNKKRTPKSTDVDRSSQDIRDYASGQLLHDVVETTEHYL
ncbi:hypothetical protein JAAARDRAFT_192309 [Jaapia argillacea MUCL 33604]|uniref:Uncharacterized protein n=1 Tax=Jaapia argillacea MUCL 33604 TaxID=933084 RepID=A0A067PYF9_9AGAM|nr:hypothetical protein JAAARDRAFT_192309 [Jaapia argillacea MUCL 33604]